MQLPKNGVHFVSGPILNRVIKSKVWQVSNPQWLIGRIPPHAPPGLQYVWVELAEISLNVILLWVNDSEFLLRCTVFQTSYKPRLFQICGGSTWWFRLHGWVLIQWIYSRSANVLLAYLLSCLANLLGQFPYFFSPDQWLKNDVYYMRIVRFVSLADKLRRKRKGR